MFTHLSAAFAVFSLLYRVKFVCVAYRIRIHQISWGVILGSLVSPLRELVAVVTAVWWLPLFLVCVFFLFSLPLSHWFTQFYIILPSCRLLLCSFKSASFIWSFLAEHVFNRTSSVLYSSQDGLSDVYLVCVMTGFLSVVSLLPLPQLRAEVSGLQGELEGKRSEMDTLETLLQRRERENQEGTNLLAMLRDDLNTATQKRSGVTIFLGRAGSHL